ncbi:TrmH family RNA methyltransferase [Streptomyces alkaliterrae]|uniref:RNA methyltransferase n=1 Tax=Streptomyces alkaliterrae TaxID=2213162 RepID=A0A5P0YUQ7_9ACTN|nr:RNA methyltransferase [Streptomyces alkaliterrae]MBB1261987.1 RNA methyltransferase [Streptomyces alkaliterrae]MQS02219.1 rRNA methyltransferase [Streptomyces alkaliterrae]
MTAGRVPPAWTAAPADSVLLDGFHAVKHALRFGATPQALLVTDRAATRALAAELAPDLVDLLDALAEEVPAETLRGLLPRAHPTGVAALAHRRPRAANLATLRALPRPAPVVLLEDPRNLGNVGAVVRLAAGMGATGVVTTGTADPWHPNAVRGGAGLHYATAVERVTLDEPPPGPLYVLDPEGEDLRDVRLPDDAVLAFGTERHGVSAGLRARADRLLALPMRPQVSSYNLATSVAMTLYHWSAAPSASAGPGSVG